MEKFSLGLANAGILTGRTTLPKAKPKLSAPPLLVCFHGGSYDSEYFDSSSFLSISRFSLTSGIPVIAIDRPGNGEGIHHIPPASSEVTYAQQQGKYINIILLTAIWREYEEILGVSAMVLLAHSIGAMVATIVTGSYTARERYPLAGLISSGFGAELNSEISSKLKGLVQSGMESLAFDPTIKDQAMLQFPHRDLVSPDMTKLTAHLNKPAPIGEFLDINLTWLRYLGKYSHAVNVPVVYGISEFDELWISTPEAVENYRQAFPSIPFGDMGVVEEVPHCIELSLQCDVWLDKCFDILRFDVRSGRVE